MATTTDADHVDDRFVDYDAFRDWAEEQMTNSRSSTSRIIVDDDEMIKFRLREETDAVEDITVIKEREADYVRFTKNGESRQFASHRRTFTYHDKTLIVRTEDGREICRAGTGTKNKTGPFPV